MIHGGIFCLHEVLIEHLASLIYIVKVLRSFLSSELVQIYEDSILNLVRMRCLSNADYYRIGSNVYLRLSPFGAKNLKIIFPKCSTIYKLSNNHIFIGIFSAD